MLYPATPLLGAGSFRVMHLLAGQAADPIRFSLQVTACDADPHIDYEALSYAWGDPTLTQEILCEGTEGGALRSLRVASNCYNALTSLRLSDKTRVLWIDAICINQDDVEERGTQVAMMRSIYSGASQVVVYLGESDNDSDSVMRYVEDQYEPVEFPRREAILKPGKNVWWSFSSRPWFTRTWVLQELYSAQRVEVRCGCMSVSWEALRDCYERRYSRALRYELRRPAAYEVVHFMQRHRMFSSDELGFRLLELLTTTRSSLSSDPRDKLYGILSMLGTSGDLPFLRPDYDRSANELFTEVALFLYGQFGSEMFRRASRSSLSGGLDFLPTWVPDWTCSGVFGVDYADANRASRKLKAGGQPISTAHPSEHLPLPGVIARRLGLQGLLVGSLTTVSDECDLDKNVFPFDQWCEIALGPEFSSSSFNTRKASELGEGDPEATRENEFQKLITYDNVIYSDVVCAAIHHILEWESDRSDSSLVTHFAQRQWGPSYLRQIHQLLNCCDKRKLAVLQNGLLALAPVFAEPEDLVYVLPGASVPFIFRKLDDHHVFVGECFVQGIMFGEAWEGKSTESLGTLIVE